MIKPTFLGIGSQRCSTTWLYDVMKQHPDIGLGDEKEINYFSKRCVLKDIKFYFNQFNSEPGSSITVWGEISPQYARLGRRRIKSIFKLLPDLKLIFFIRHPMHRAWSGTCYELGGIKGLNLSKISIIRYLLHLNRARTRLYNNYYQTICNWQQVYPKEAILICLQDQIRSNPREVLKEVFTHIGVRSPCHLSDAQLERPTNTTEKKSHQQTEPIPDTIKWHLANELLPQVRQLNALLEGKVQHWVDELSVITIKQKPDWWLGSAFLKLLHRIPDHTIWNMLECIRDVVLEHHVARWHKEVAPEI